MEGWRRSGRGEKLRLVASLDEQEVAVLRGLVAGVQELLADRAGDAPADELSVLTGIRTGPTTRPTDRVLARLLPDFTTDDDDLAAGLRSLHEPALIDAKEEAARVVVETLPDDGGQVRLTPDQADAWLTALNDVRLALGTLLDVSEEMVDDLPPDDPRAPHMDVYQWLTHVQDALVMARMRVG